MTLEFTKEVFESACRSHADLMEPYMVRLDGLNASEQQEVMRAGLRETVKLRFPLKNDPQD